VVGTERKLDEVTRKLRGVATAQAAAAMMQAKGMEGQPDASKGEGRRTGRSSGGGE
jgi:hypothetical protein